MFPNEKSLCQAPNCLVIFPQKPGGRRREFCSDKCRKTAARLGRREQPKEKLATISDQMRDVSAQLTQIQRDFVELDTKFWAIVDWWGSTLTDYECEIVGSADRIEYAELRPSTFQSAISNQEGDSLDE
jgi:hypothetical protein